MACGPVSMHAFMLIAHDVCLSVDLCCTWPVSTLPRVCQVYWRIGLPRVCNEILASTVLSSADESSMPLTQASFASTTWRG